MKTVPINLPTSPIVIVLARPPHSGMCYYGTVSGWNVQCDSGSDKQVVVVLSKATELCGSFHNIVKELWYLKWFY